jgi:hypothetical protein
MTLSSKVTKVVYEADGATASWPVPFPVFDAGDVECIHVAGGAETVLTGFTVSGMADNNIYVVFAAPPPAGTLVVRRGTDRVQESDYPVAGRFPAKTVERDHDRIVAMIQEIDETFSRAVLFDAAQSEGMNASEFLTEVNGLKAGAEAALADAEQCRDQACECAGEAEEAKDAAEEAAENAAQETADEIRDEMFSYAQDAAGSLAQINAVFDELQNLPAGQRLPVMQVDPTTETLVPEPHGVDPASVADEVDGLTLDISQGDYALVLTDETVDVDGAPHSAVALYRGVGADAGSYTGVFAKILGDTGPIIPTYALGSRTPTAGGLTELDVSYVNWSVGALPQAGVEEGAFALVQGKSQEQYVLYRRESGAWMKKYTGNTFFLAVSEDRFLVTYATVDAFGAGPNHAVLGLNAWVPVDITDPDPAPVDLPESDTAGDGIVCQGTTIGGGYPEWEFVRNLPVENLDLFGITKPLDPDSRIYVWFRNAWVPWESKTSVEVGLPLLSVFWSWKNSENGCLNLSATNGQLARDVYPDAWEAIQELPGAMLISDTAWLAEVASSGTCNKFSAGDGETTFRVPLWGPYTAPGAPGDGHGAGRFAEDAMRPITGRAGFSSGEPWSYRNGRGCISWVSDGQGNIVGDQSAGGTGNTSFAIDSALLGSHYDGSYTHGPTAVMYPHIKMYAVPPTVEQDQLQAVTEAQANMVHVGSSWGMPDWGNNVDIQLPYTTQNDGCIVIGTSSQSSDIYVNGLQIKSVHGGGLRDYVVVKSGDVVTSNTSPSVLKFVPLIKDAGQTAAIPSVQQYVDERQDAFNSYSTDETWTGGYWIDGKKIWRKVFTGSWGVSSGGWTTLFTIPEITSLVQSICYRTASGGMNFTDISSIAGLSLSGTTLMGWASSAQTISGIMLEYTKTA